MRQHIKFSRLTVFGSMLLTALLVFSSCIKNYEPNETNFNGLKPTVLIPEGGLTTFSSEALTFPGTDSSDTASFHVNYAATNVAPVDETITIGIDPSALAAYNSLGGVQYVLFPDSIFNFTTTTVVVKKGDNYTSAIPVIVYPVKVDPTHNYMLPISITAVPAGATISANYQTIYYHLIGNPIAGAYDQEWIRYNEADTTGTPDYDLDLGTVIFSPLDPTDIEAVSLGTGEGDIIGFTNNSGVLSGFTVSITPVTGITEGTPVLEQADPVNGIYRVYFTYLNGSGDPRSIINIYRKE